MKCLSLKRAFEKKAICTLFIVYHIYNFTYIRSNFSDESLSPGKFTRQTEETDHDYTEDGYDASNMEQFHVEYVKHVEEPKEGEHCVHTT